MSRSDRDLNQLFYDMANQAAPPDAAGDAARRRQRAIGGMRALHRHSVDAKSHAVRRRRRLVLTLSAAAAALVGTALAAGGGWLPFRFHESTHGAAVAPRPALAKPTPRAEAPRATSMPPSVPELAHPTAPEAVVPVSPPNRVAKPRSVDLEQVNQLFADAKRARREHRDADELALLQQLLTEHPGSVLTLEASVERFRALARLGRNVEAARYANLYLARYPNGYAADEARSIVGNGAP